MFVDVVYICGGVKFTLGCLWFYLVYFQPMGDDMNYECMLDEQSLQKATKELNEDPKERLGALQTLREWVKQQKWIKSPTGRPSVHYPTIRPPLRPWAVSI